MFTYSQTVMYIYPFIVVCAEYLANASVVKIAVTDIFDLLPI
jgi:hypothetical protein